MVDRNEWDKIYSQLINISASDNNLVNIEENINKKWLNGALGIIAGSLALFIIKFGQKFRKSRENTKEDKDYTEKGEHPLTFNRRYIMLTPEQREWVDKIGTLSEEFNGKKESMRYMAVFLLSEGYEVEFVCGALGNIQYEGDAGRFEDATYVKNTPPNYIVKLNEEANYSEEFSGKNITEVGIDAAEDLAAIGQYGLGACQWTNHARKDSLLRCYREVCGDENYPTIEQVMEAEALCMFRELKGEEGYENYSAIYEKWKSECYLDVEKAAELFAKGYEKPDTLVSTGEVRIEAARRIYNHMMGIEE